MAPEYRWRRASVLCVLAAVACLALGWGLLGRWWAPVHEGWQSLKWPSVPGEIIYATFRSDYNAESSSEYEVRDEYTYLAVAYWAPGAGGQVEPLVARRFDAADGLWEQPGLFAGNPDEIRHVLHAGDSLRVRYDPKDPKRALIHPGPPRSMMVLLALPVLLLGQAIGFLRCALRMARVRETVGNESKRDELRHAELGLWPVFFLMSAGIWSGCLPVLWVSFSGQMPPSWLLPNLYGFALVAYAAPFLVKLRPMRDVVLLLGLSLPLILIVGAVVMAMTDNRTAFGTDWSHEEVVQRLGAEHPAISEDAAWTVMRRKGPRSAAQGLQKLLQSPSIGARRAAAAALTRIGIVALPALDAVEAAVEEPRNAEIRAKLETTREHLRGFIWAQQKVEEYRFQLIHGEDEQVRNAAAFSLGYLGEAAVSALPDLRRATRDPRNRNFDGNFESVIRKLEHHQHLMAQP